MSPKRFSHDQLKDHSKQLVNVFMCMTLCHEVDITSAEMEPPNQRCKPYVEVVGFEFGGRVVALDYQACREWQAILLASLGSMVWATTSMRTEEP